MISVIEKSSEAQRRHAVITNQTVRANGPDPICTRASLSSVLSSVCVEMEGCKIGFTVSALITVRFSDLIEFSHVSVLGKGERWVKING